MLGISRMTNVNFLHFSVKALGFHDVCVKTRCALWSLSVTLHRTISNWKFDVLFYNSVNEHHINRSSCLVHLCWLFPQLFELLAYAFPLSCAPSLNLSC